MDSLSWTAQGVWGFVRTGIELGVRGIRRCWQHDDGEATSTRLILDPHTQRPSAIEGRSESLDGSVKRRRIIENDGEYDFRSGMRIGGAIGNGSQLSSTNRRAGQSRRSPNSSISPNNMKLHPRQHLGPSSSLHNIQSQRRQPHSSTLSYQRQNSQNEDYGAQYDNASTNFTAGIQWDGGFSTSQSNHNQDEIASMDRTAGIQLPSSPRARLHAIVAARNHKFQPRVPGAEQYSSKYDLVTKPKSAELLRYPQVRPIRSPKTKSRQHPFHKADSKKKHVSFITGNYQSSPEPEKKQASFGSRKNQTTSISREKQEAQETQQASPIPKNDQDSRGSEKQDSFVSETFKNSITRVSQEKQSSYRDPFDAIEEEIREAQRQAELEKRTEEERIVKEKKFAEDESQRIALALFRNESFESAKKEDEATLKARADARIAAADKLRKEATIGQAEKEEEAKREYAKRTARVEEEDVAFTNGMTWQDRSKKVRRPRPAASFGKLWSPNPRDKMLTARNTNLNSRLTGHLPYSPEVKTTEPEKAVHIALSPNTGLEAVQHKIFDKTEPSTQLKSPQGPWPRRGPFFTRSFDSLLRLPDGSNPPKVATGEAWGLSPRTAAEGTIPKSAKVFDTPIEMSDAPELSEEPISAINSPAPSLVDDTSSSTPSKSSSPESVQDSTQTYVRPYVSDEDADINDISIDELQLSQLSLQKVEAVRSDRRAATEKAQREKEEAEEKARAEAAEAERKKVEEERKKAEEERKKAEEEARAAEAERLATGGRRMPTEPFVKPLDQSWEAKLGHVWKLATSEEGFYNFIAKSPDDNPLLAKDFRTVLGGTAWLNDEIINSYLALVCKEANAAAGTPDPKHPKYVAQTSFFYSKLSNPEGKGPKDVARWFKKYAAMGEDLFNLDYIFIPVNNSNHWTLLIVSPKYKTIEYLDSFGGDPAKFVSNIRLWLKDQLKGKYVESEWTVPQTRCARQFNGYDCGVFTITNAKCVALGVDPMCYAAKDMAMQRKRIAAELINGGSLA